MTMLSLERGGCCYRRWAFYNWNDWND